MILFEDILIWLIIKLVVVAVAATTRINVKIFKKIVWQNIRSIILNLSPFLFVAKTKRGRERM